MVASPALAAEGVVKVVIYSAGKPLDDKISLLSISVEKQLNCIPRATVVIADGDMEDKDFPLSNEDLFKPGGELRIEAGYGDKAEEIFSGVVIRHSIRIASGNRSSLVVECRDPTYRMTLQRKNANFLEASDADIIAALVKPYNDISATVGSTPHKHEELVQYYCTDWDYLVSRAEMSGMVVNVDGGKVDASEPKTGSADLSVTWGDDLMDFDARIDARSQVTSVKSMTWDPKKQEVVDKSSGPVGVTTQGDLDSSKLASDIGNPLLVLQTSAPQADAVLTSWAKSQQIKASLARVQGSMKFRGSARAKPGSSIDLQGVGRRFSGVVFLSAVKHEISAGEWITEASFGMSPDWFVERKNVEAPRNGGISPGVDGLQIGRVEKLDEDPGGNARIQVSVPVLDAEKKGVWARLAGFYASSEVGAYFLPEVGDEVVLGYLNNDPAAPVVLGSLYSGSRKPPYEIDGKNPVKAIVTREKLKIEFDEDKKSISIETPGKNTIVLSDDAKSIVLEDQHGNKYESKDSGIKLTSKKAIEIDAGGKVTITGSHGVDMGKSAAPTNVKGSTVNIN